MLDFFSLGETFLVIGMRLGGGIMQFKIFGNLAHPNIPNKKINFTTCFGRLVGLCSYKAISLLTKESY